MRTNGMSHKQSSRFSKHATVQREFCVPFRFTIFCIFIAVSAFLKYGVKNGKKNGAKNGVKTVQKTVIKIITVQRTFKKQCNNVKLQESKHECTDRTDGI